MAAVRITGRSEPVGARTRLAAAIRPRSRARDADARRGLRPACAGAGDGRQLPADAGDVSVVGWGEQGLTTTQNVSCRRTPGPITTGIHGFGKSSNSAFLKRWNAACGPPTFEVVKYISPTSS